jgi:hypothetical protein
LLAVLLGWVVFFVGRHRIVLTGIELGSL